MSTAQSHPSPETPSAASRVRQPGATRRATAALIRASGFWVRRAKTMPPLAKMAHQQDGRTSSSDSEGDADETTVLVAGHLGGSQEPQPRYDNIVEDRDDSSPSSPRGAPLNDSAEPGAPAPDNIMSPRAYQLELFQASLEQNIIVSVRHPQAPISLVTYHLLTFGITDGYRERQDSGASAP